MSGHRQAHTRPVHAVESRSKCQCLYPHSTRSTSGMHRWCISIGERWLGRKSESMTDNSVHDTEKENFSLKHTCKILRKALFEFVLVSCGSKKKNKEK